MCDLVDCVCDLVDCVCDLVDCVCDLVDCVCDSVNCVCDLLLSNGLWNSIFCIKRGILLSTPRKCHIDLCSRDAIRRGIKRTFRTNSSESIQLN